MTSTSPLPFGMRTAQGAASKTWTPPSLDGSILVPELLDHHLARSASHTWAVTPAGVRISTLEFARSAYRAGQFVRESVKKCGAEKVEPTEKDEVVVGVLSETEAFVYAATALGIARAGYTPLLLSTRNSAPALCSILSKTSTHILLYTSSSPSLSGLAEATQAELRQAGHHLQLVPMPRLLDVYTKFGDETAADEFEHDLPAKLGRRDAMGIILHSSGSTSFPKPIRISHAVWLEWARAPWYGTVDICDTRFFAGSLPTFHAMGFMIQLVLPLSTGVELGLLDPVSPPTFPTPTVTLKGIKDTKSNYIIVVPSIIETWATDDEAVEVMKGAERVLFGGAALNGPVGDALSAKGIKLTSVFGATEVGCGTTFMGPPQGADWSYLRLSSQCKPRLVPQDDGLFELQYIACDSHNPSVLNLEDVRGYTTNDLVERHPTDPELIRIVGRADDQIMLSTGEKTNPGPLERIIASNAQLQNALFFGRGKVSNGVILEPGPGHEVQPGDEAAKQKLIDAVWPDIERANAHAPQHSRLFRNLVLIADPARPFQLTPKASVKRTPTLEQYKGEIEAAYNAAPETTGVEPLDLADLEGSVAQIVRSVMQQQDLQLDADLIARGCDSLQATHIRNKLSAALLATPDQPQTLPKIPENIVFQHPSISDLASFIRSLVSGAATENTPEAQTAKIEAMIHKYSALFPAPPAQLDTAPRPAQVLVTGTTGGLGAQLLQSLIRSSDVERVFAVNRSNRSAGLAERQRASFVARGLDVGMLDSPKLVLVEADLTKSDLAVEASVLSDIRANVSQIIHNAWRVNFDLTLQSFESDIIGLKNLIDLAITSPRQPAVLFTSSIGALRGWPMDRFAPEEPIQDTRIVIGQGYGEGKYVGEKMLQEASEVTGIRTTILRVGQLSGSLSSGSWNSTDWVPSIIKSGAVLGCLPTGEDVISWLPVDIAGEAIVEMSLARTPSTPTHEMLHVVHPNVAPWSTAFGAVVDFYVSRGQEVKLVPYAQWLAALEKDAERGPEAMARNPAAKLLGMFRHGSVEAKARKNTEGMGIARLETGKACAASRALKELPPLKAEDAWKWMESWEKEGFLKV